MNPYPILEFDPSRSAIIEADIIHKPLETMPGRVVLCFFAEVIDAVCRELPVITKLNSEIGKNPVYSLTTDSGETVAICHPGVGAPLAGSFLEELIAHGGRKFVACGGAGALDEAVGLGHVVVPTAAVRDEGTSYHYLPPSREVMQVPAGVAAIEATLNAHGVPYQKGKTWTTDAPYRETRAKVQQRRDEGCLTVEMEAAAFFAIAQFRDVPFGQMLYGGDDLSGETWDHRNWDHGQASTREKLFWLAVEAVERL